MKKCPYCAEEIQDEAIKCRYCGEFLDESVRASRGKPPLKWYFRGSFIVFSIFCVGPLALPLIWWRPQTRRSSKIVLTIVILALTWFMVQATIDSIRVLKECYQLLEEM